jgi:4-hydroxy-4-methyl-2-oxoglutarate aldolase
MSLTHTRVKAELVSAFSTIQAATIHEAQGGIGAVTADIRPLDRTMSLCGPALTIKMPPADNLALHQALYLAEPGDVLVVDCASHTEAGQWGGILMEAAKARGIAGLITNGSVRDTDELIEGKFPVFSRGISIKGTAKNPGARIGEPMIFEGVSVAPGDLIRADADGIVFVSKETAAAVLEKSRARIAKEDDFTRRIRNGETTLDLYGFPAYSKAG